MGGGYSFPADKHIVIVGGGFAGVALATELLNNNANFTLIDCKDVFYQNTSAIRTIVEKGKNDFLRDFII